MIVGWIGLWGPPSNDLFVCLFDLMANQIKRDGTANDTTQTTPTISFDNENTYISEYPQSTYYIGV